jgi:hypothetical protein
VFFEDQDFDAGAGEKEAEHHTGRAASCDAAGGLCGLRGSRFDDHESSLG